MPTDIMDAGVRASSVEEAREMLLSAIIRQAGSPVGRTGVEVMAEQLDEVGEQQFRAMYRNKPPERAIAEMLAGSCNEGLWCDMPNTKPSIAEAMSVDTARFEAMLALAQAGDMSYAPIPDENDFGLLLAVVANDSQDGAAKYFSELESRLLRFDESHKPQVTIPKQGVCQRTFKPTNEIEVSELNKDLTNNWALAASSKDGTARLYVDEHDSSGQSLRCVSDIGSGMLGQLVFTNAGSQKIDGAYLTSIGMFPTVTDISTPTLSGREGLIEQVKAVIDEYGMDNMLPAQDLSPNVDAIVKSCFPSGGSDQPPIVPSASTLKAPGM